MVSHVFRGEIADEFSRAPEACENSPLKLRGAWYCGHLCKQVAGSDCKC